MYGLNWNLLRSFLAVAEQGSLSAAGRQLGLSQPTVGRHIQELEAQLELELFERHPKGLSLTQRGASLYEVAIGVSNGVDRLARQAAGMSAEVSGTVRISASEVVAHFVLPSIVAKLRERHPNLHLEIVADNAVANLLRRDADIAVRMFKPEQTDLIGRKVAEAQVALFASPDYLEVHGEPKTPEDLSEHTTIGLDRDPLQVRFMKEVGVEVVREDFALRSDSQSFHVHAVVSGAGIAGLQVAVANRFGGLKRVVKSLPLPTLPVWLVAHGDLKKSARVRAAFDHLADGLAAFYREAK